MLNRSLCPKTWRHLAFDLSIRSSHFGSQLLQFPSDSNEIISSSDKKTYFIYLDFLKTKVLNTKFDQVLVHKVHLICISIYSI